ncbi:hypothetical protein ACIBTV_15960 [Micromonospora sp. NPDC049366]|uniref:hypothetical protein n=1 Tax=Micromonospora sp. NPDC049366 TaxID=3364271 RepID=UPI00379E38C5
MTVRRQAARLATVCALLGGLVALGASPAQADDDSVRVRAASTFDAGGSPEGVNVEVRKRSDGCVQLRTTLGLRLSGLRADQVTVQVSYGRQWFPVPLGGGDGALVTSPTSPAKPNLCKGKGITVRYRVAFAPEAPNGRLTVVGAATDALDHLLGRGSDASRVVGGRASASPTPSETPSPTPTVVETEVATAAETDQTPTAPVAPSDVAAAATESSGLSPIMFVGLGLVALGALLIGLLIRRSRADKATGGEPVGPLPGNAGGTTYRSAGGPPAAPGQMYGQPPAGGTYGAPQQRPAGGVYGARPAAPAPDQTRPLPPSGQWAAPANSAPATPGPDETRPLPPGQWTAPAAPGSTTPGQPDVPPGEHTVIMPRLPE